MDKITMMTKALFIVGLLAPFAQSNAQTTFEKDPSKAEFVTSDIPMFWEAFDQMDSKKNPFREYLENGSVGLKGFIPYRIESPKKLLKVVKKRKADYEQIRDKSFQVELHTSQIRTYYQVFKELYNSAVFPPTYFVIGAFNSGGTISENGLIIGVEVQSNVEELPYVVAHELIHFNQVPLIQNSLLAQSLKEGGADFVSEMISGKNVNAAAFKYGMEHEKELCAEYVVIMNDKTFHGWLYGSNGKKEGRPNDLGYWMGYKICEAYYSKASNKKEAIKEIITVTNYKEFIDKSGYLSTYMSK